MKIPRRRMFYVAILIAFVTLLPYVGAQSPSANSPAYGNCPAPATAGVHICQPFNFNHTTTIAAPFQIIASGTGAEGPVAHMELWIDYVKVRQTAGNIFDAPINLNSGNHRLVMVELDTAGSYMKSTPLTVNVQGITSEECPPPASPGVNVCDPLPNSCHTSAWTSISASGTGASGSVHRMELWSGGVKLANFPGNTVLTNLYLSDFSTVTIVEVDSTGGVIKSPRITLQSC